MFRQSSKLWNVILNKFLDQLFKKSQICTREELLFKVHCQLYQPCCADGSALIPPPDPLPSRFPDYASHVSLTDISLLPWIRAHATLFMLSRPFIIFLGFFSFFLTTNPIFPFQLHIFLNTINPKSASFSYIS